MKSQSAKGAHPKASRKISSIYGEDQSLATFTDLYQLTMAYGYFKTGQLDTRAIFHMYFRKNPFGGGFAVASGISTLVDFVANFRFHHDDIQYLASLKGHDKQTLFDRAFLDYLADLRLSVDIDCVDEGEIVFAHEPIFRVEGPVIECQLLETALLNFVNFETLIATKAARVKLAAQNREVLEFGLRRAQGIDGALSASRAAYLGGCDATSNVMAGKLFGIPIRGTHAHSWVMTFDCELEAFRQYAKALPNNCVFLVDTYDTLRGVEHAIEVGRELQAEGHALLGIRLDSGDLAYLSAEARRMLNASGFESTKIVASNDLDEEVITSLIDQGSRIDVWGVGTKLVTGHDQGALGGVYKLSAIKKSGSKQWIPKLKLSEQAIKISTPGCQQIRRFYQLSDPSKGTGNKKFVGDMIYDLHHPDERDKGDQPYVIVDPTDITRRKKAGKDQLHEDLLKPLFKEGQLVQNLPSLEQARALVAQRLQQFHPSILRFLNPHQYPVGLELGLMKRKHDLILKERGHHD